MKFFAVSIPILAGFIPLFGLLDSDQKFQLHILHVSLIVTFLIYLFITVALKLSHYLIIDLLLTLTKNSENFSPQLASRRSNHYGNNTALIERMKFMKTTVENLLSITISVLAAFLYDIAAFPNIITDWRFRIYIMIMADFCVPAGLIISSIYYVKSLRQIEENVKIDAEILNQKEICNNEHAKRAVQVKESATLDERKDNEKGDLDLDHENDNIEKHFETESDVKTGPSI